MNEDNKTKKEEQDHVISKLTELSGRIILMQKDSRYKELFEEVIKYLKIIQRDIAIYFIFICFLLFILLYLEYLRKILSVIF